MDRVNKVLTACFTALVMVFLIMAVLGCNDSTGPDNYQAPRNLQGEYTGKSIALKWETSVNNEETGYEVWRKAGGGSYESIATLGKSLTYNDPTVAPGNTYTYKVRTLYDGNAGPYSNEVTVNT
jgi:hypothetical protein